MLRGIVIVLFCACWSCLKGNLLVTVIQLSERTPMPFRFVLESTAAGAARRISWCHKSKENATAGRRQMSLLGVQWNALRGTDLMRACVSVASQLGQVRCACTRAEVKRLCCGFASESNRTLGSYAQLTTRKLQRHANGKSSSEGENALS